MKQIGIFLAMTAAVVTACQTRADGGAEQMGGAVTVVVDAENIVGTVSPLIYGAGAEDVNHEIYGGLYDQRIFGESFEEKAETRIAGWHPYDEEWTVSSDELRLTTTKHGKIVCEELGAVEGVAEVEVRLDGEHAIAGFILGVSEAGNGADHFIGYEVALNGEKGHLVFGRHQQNWQPIANTPLTFDAKNWNLLKVVFKGGDYNVSVNGKKVYAYKEEKDVALKGMLGLRSFAGSASFRKLKVNGRAIPFVEEQSGVSRMWKPVGEGVFFLDEKRAFHGKRAQVIRGGAGTGVANMGLNGWGIDIEEGQRMLGSLSLKGDCPKVVVALESADGKTVYAQQEIEGIEGDWKRFTYQLLPAGGTDHRGRFVIRLADTGTVWADQVLLHTENYPFRQDITEAFIAEGLTFLRYGGCMVNAADFRVRDQRGPAAERPPYRGWWYEESSNGFGIPEFVRFARLIGTEPCFGVNVEDDPAEVLALLKELEPYRLHYLQIGNEEMIGTKDMAAYDHYCERFKLFYDAIHPLFPEIEFVSAAWWRSKEPELMERTFRALDGMCSLWDYHPWTETFAQAKAAEQEVALMRERFRQWNPQTKMRCAILEENGNTHNLQRGLVHALMLNIVRRTDGFVPLDSPANALQPWLQNDNGWDQGQIFFDTHHAWGQPPYWVQVMASHHHQPLVVATEVDDEMLDVVATRNEKGDTLVLHIVNMAEEGKALSLDLRHFGRVRTLQTTSISGHANDHNLPDDPLRIAPEEQLLPHRTKSFPIKPYSYTVVELTRK